MRITGNPFWDKILFILLIIAIVYLAIGILIYIFQAKFIYFPDKNMEGRILDLKHQSIFFKTADGQQIYGWYVPRKQTDPVILFFHGNAGNISGRIELIKYLYDLGCAVFIIDYRGYGHSTGTPNEKGTYLDSEAALNYLTKTLKIPAHQIIIYGKSLGGAIAARLAFILSQKSTPPKALILDSAFTSVVDVAAKMFPFYPVSLLARFHYPTKEYILQVKCPVLIIHSKNDEIIPFTHGKNLYQKAQQPKKMLILTGSHNYISPLPEYLKGISDFLQNLPDK